MNFAWGVGLLTFSTIVWQYFKISVKWYVCLYINNIKLWLGICNIILYIGHGTPAGRLHVNIQLHGLIIIIHSFIDVRVILHIYEQFTKKDCMQV